jgi:hypothetical protein
MDDARFMYLLRRFNLNPRKIYHVIRELGKWMNGQMDGWVRNWEQWFFKEAKENAYVN